MANVLNILVSLAAGGIGGLIVQYFKFILDKKIFLSNRSFDILEDKYRYFLIMMSCSLDISKRKYYSLNEANQIETSEEYFNQIKEYYYSSAFYFPDNVLLSIKAFIENPCEENYLNTCLVMRKSLWKIKSQSYESLRIDLKMKNNCVD